MESIAPSPLNLVLIGTSFILMFSLGIAFYWNLRLFRGFQSQKHEIRAIARFIRGSLRRDRKDLEIVGKYEGRRVKLQLSDRDDAPACLIEMECVCPAKFVVTADEGIKRAIDRFAFNGRYWAYTFDSGASKQFLNTGGDALIRKVLASKEWSIRVRRGTVRLGMLRFPSDFASHCMTCIPVLYEIGKILQHGRAASAQGRALRFLSVACAGAILAAAALLGLRGASEKPVSASGPSELTEIQDSSGWKPVSEDDFDSATKEWLKKSGYEPHWKTTVDLHGKQQPATAYFLSREGGVKRLAIVSSSKTSLFDANSDDLVLIRSIPRESLAKIPWRRPLERPMEGEALLAIYKGARGSHSEVLYMDANRILSAIPQDLDPTR